MHRASFLIWITAVFLGAIIMGCALASAFNLTERISLWRRRNIKIRQCGRVRWVSADELVGYFEHGDREWL